MALHPPRCTSRAFTLIELLVVIAIVGLLIAILLPALGRARESGRIVVCSSNVRQVMLGMIAYAGDYRVMPGTYWQGPINLDWSGRNNARYNANPSLYKHPFETSVMYEYLAKADLIFECPSAKREANRYFDYTMVIRFAGARPDVQWTMDYPELPQAPTSARRVLPGIALLVEEHDAFYNASVDDGSFANLDQISTRHAARRAGSAGGGAGGGGHMGLIDGGVIFFKAPAGPDDRIAEPQDLTANHFRIRKGGTLLHPIGSSSPNEFGWINNAK